jgi:hypothetical protein
MLSHHLAGAEYDNICNVRAQHTHARRIGRMSASTPIPTSGTPTTAKTRTMYIRNLRPSGRMGLAGSGARDWDPC